MGAMCDIQQTRWQGSKPGASTHVSLRCHVTGALQQWPMPMPMPMRLFCQWHDVPRLFCFNQCGCSGAMSSDACLYQCACTLCVLPCLAATHLEHPAISIIDIRPSPPTPTPHISCPGQPYPVTFCRSHRHGGHPGGPTGRHFPPKYRAEGPPKGDGALTIF